MPLLRYVGGVDEVYLRDVGVFVKRGETVDVPDETVASSLLAQETFEPAKATKRADAGTDAKEA